MVAFDYLHASEAIASVTPKLFIDGKFVDAASGKTFDDICPMNQKPMLAIAEGDAEDVDAAVKAARHAFEQGPWSTMSGRERGKLLFKWADILEQHAEELATLESVDVGKTLTMARLADIPSAIGILRYMAGWADKIQGDTIPTADGTLCYTVKEPIGVVGAIVPWNYPLCMLMNKVAPALAAGCAVVAKCAEQTPLTALKVAELSVQAGLPPGVLNVVPGFGPTAGAALCNHRGVDKLAFTGSVEVGKLVMEAAAKRVCSVTLELGGKSPLIVCEDADLETAAQIAHQGLFFNHGQVCTACSRIYVHESIADAFMKRSVELAQAIKVGDPFAAETTQGPQVDKAQFDKILHYVQLGKEQGAKLLCGGDRAADIGYYIQPTVFGDVTQEMAIFQEEIFGPVMSIIRFKDLDEAIASANTTIYGLASGVVSKNIDTINKVSRKLKAGTVWANTWNYFDVGLPFGGVKQSGIGREYGRESLDNYLESKSVVLKGC